MPFDRPTLGALIRTGEAGFVARIPGADLALRRSNLKVSARVFAGLLHEQYGYLDWQFVQVLPDTAEGEYLDRWAGTFGLTRKGATKAAGLANFTGTAGLVVPAGTVLTRPDGIQFATVASLTLTGGTGTIGVLAVAGGAEANLPGGTSLALVSAIPGLIGIALLDAAGTTGGTSAELDPPLRARLLQRIRNPPQGGAAHDYVAWATAVPGVTRAWALPLNRGPGTIDVTFVMDDRLDIIPTPADVAAVQAAINQERPVTANSLVFAPTPVLVPVTATGLVTNSALVRQAAVDKLAVMFRRDAAPGATLWRSRISEAISAATGEEHHVLTSPATDAAYGTGQMPILGTVSFP